ncbi:MAG: hypothetical protein JWQ87_2864 [Candidatus Sulfotelmatobacter sp.]|nr:hypothetical protein [Candidatus Sulfotelmatobacter sp.]
MWKKLNDDVGAQSEFASKQTTELEALGNEPDESLVDSQFEKWNFAAGSQKGAAKDDRPPSPSSSNLTSAPTMATYTEALNEFAKSATAFIEQLPLLTKARNAYEQAIKAGAELRKVLDTGEENLQTLMTQLEQAVSIHAVKPAGDRKRPEAANVEPIRAAEESNSGVKRFS